MFNHKIRLAVAPTMVGISVLLAACASPSAEPAPALSNEHVDLTREVLAARPPIEAVVPQKPDPVVERPASNAPVREQVAAPAESSEVWTFEDDGEMRTTPAPKDAVQAVLTYPLCMERSIRAGNRYAESSRVCGALFGS
jgi:hypothetical protein